MEEAKKHRSRLGGTVTRRIQELHTAIRCDAEEAELVEKINKLKVSMEGLGTAQDAYMQTIDADKRNPAIDEAENWYQGYDERASTIISEARRQYKRDAEPTTHTSAKIQKLCVPKFDSTPKSYYKWKLTFERYLKDMDDDSKYDYLRSCADYKAYEHVSSQSTYRAAINKLDKEYGNVHEIMKILLDEIRCLPRMREFEYSAFEHLSFKANNFRDRLIEMRLHEDVENKYILNEIESKLHKDDLHKWLESQGDAVDDRRVETLAAWLDKQTHLHRIVEGTSMSSKLSSRRNMFDYPGQGKHKKIDPVLMTPTIPAPGSVQSSRACGLCNQNHVVITDCAIFPLLACNEKWDYVKDGNVCFVCLSGHQRSECVELKCGICQGPNHPLLHNPRKPPQVVSSRNNNAGYLSSSATCTKSQQANENPEERVRLSPGRCFLPVVNVMLRNNDKRYIAKALLDSGSELNVITTKCYQRLQLAGTPVSISITGAGGVVTKRKTQKVELSVVDANGQETQIDCIVLNEACGKLLPINKDLLEMAKSQFDINTEKLVSKGGEIDILIGMSSPQIHQQLSMRGKPNVLHVIETRFGPCMVGPASKQQEGNYKNGVLSASSANIIVDLDSVKNDELAKFIEAELAGVNKECSCQTKTDDELRFEEAMKTSWITKEDGRLQIHLPWKSDPGKLENNRYQAISRDAKLREYLRKKEEVFKLFIDQINEMIEGGGGLRKVEPSYPKRYLPLLAVINRERESTKVRVCLDSKSKYKGVSVNDALLKGRLEMTDIFQAITRFRAGRNAILGDIKKMFWQIRLSEEDQMYHGVSWDGNTYAFTRVCFGDKNSPPIADYSMKKIAAVGKDDYPLAYETLMNKRYVDDIADASSNEQLIINKRQETEELLNQTMVQ